MADSSSTVNNPSIISESEFDDPQSVSASASASASVQHQQQQILANLDAIQEQLKTSMNDDNKNKNGAKKRWWKGKLKYIFIIFYFLPPVIIYGFLYSLYRNHMKGKKIDQKKFKVLSIQTALIASSNAMDLSHVLSDNDSIPFQSLITLVRKATFDTTVLGISLIFDGYSDLGFAKTQELMEELRKFKSVKLSNKPPSTTNTNTNTNMNMNATSEQSQSDSNELLPIDRFILGYGRNIDMKDYTLSSICDELYLQDSGSLNIYGFSFPQIFYKHLLEKIGVQPFVLKREKYKTFANAFIHDHTTAEHRESLANLGGNIYSQLLSIMGGKLNEPRDVCETIVDNAPYVSAEGNELELITDVFQTNQYLLRLSELGYDIIDTLTDAPQSDSDSDNDSDSDTQQHDDEQAEEEEEEEEEEDEDEDLEDILFVNPKEYRSMCGNGNASKFGLFKTIALLRNQRSSAGDAKNEKQQKKKKKKKKRGKGRRIMDLSDGKWKRVAGKIALINIEGEITNGESDASSSVGALTVEQLLTRACMDASVKGIVLRIDSPGGDAIASEMIWNAVWNAKHTYHKPIVASMGDLCASGGYYIASAADHIVGLPATITGSIGVILMMLSVNRLLTEHLHLTIDTEDEALKFGANSDLASLAIHNEFPPPARLVDRLDAQIEHLYRVFMEKVSVGRGLDLRAVRELAQGKVYTGEQAKELGLMDAFGGLLDAKYHCEQLCRVGEFGDGEEDGEEECLEMVKFSSKMEQLFEMLDGLSESDMKLMFESGRGRGSGSVRGIGIGSGIGAMVDTCVNGLKMYYKWRLLTNNVAHKYVAYQQLKPYYLFEPSL